MDPVGEPLPSFGESRDLALRLLHENQLDDGLGRPAPCPPLALEESLDIRGDFFETGTDPQGLEGLFRDPVHAENDLIETGIEKSRRPALVEERRIGGDPA